MADVQVTCINKQPRNNPYEGITHLGGYNWWWTRDEVIGSILQKTNTFYTKVNGNRSDLVVMRGPGGLYVRTDPDGQLPDNLLSLAECPMRR